MDYRDWRSGELVRRTRQHDAAEQGGPSESPGDETRAPDRRPGRRSAERYVPAWAREESGSGGGRHRQEDPADPPSRAGSRRRTTETTGRWQTADTTGGWRAADTGSYQDEGGRAGRRRAREDDDSGATHRALPSAERRALPSAEPSSFTPQALTSSPGTRAGDWESPTSTGGWLRSGGTPWEESTSAGGWTASADVEWRSARSRAVDGRSRTVDGRAGHGARELESGDGRVVDWERTPAVDPWARPDDTSTGVIRWDRGTGRFIDPEPGGRSAPDRLRESSEARGGPEDEDPHRYGRRETFWSGTRLAGDDPRWMDTPASAPSSPVVGYPRPGLAHPPPTVEPHGSTIGADRVAGTPEWNSLGGTPSTRPGFGGTAPARPGFGGNTPARADLGGTRSTGFGGTTAARPGTGGPRRVGASRQPTSDAPGRRVPAPAAGRGTAVGRSAIRSDRWRSASVGLSHMPARLDSDLLIESERGSTSAALLCTLVCYAVPVLVLFGWLITLDGRVPQGCVTDVTGGGCQSPRAHALESLLAGAPQFGAALLASLVVAVLIRRASGAWRSLTVGVAAAVVGGGLSTVLFTALSGTG